MLKILLPKLIFLWCFVSGLTYAQESHTIKKSYGQTIYVPSYSHVYIGNRSQEYNLSTTLLIRNTDPERQLRITSAIYYDSEGQEVREYLEEAYILAPLESWRIIIPDDDRSGGAGANFLVKWDATELVHPPMTETVNIGERFGLGVSFINDGQVINELAEPVEP
jgi:hypothetical protein